jgi:hypothetical protein
MKGTSNTAVLDRLLDPLARLLTPAARVLVDYRADAVTRALIEDLGERCNEGKLTREEREEYEACVRAINFIAALQSKARRILAKSVKR